MDTNVGLICNNCGDTFWDDFYKSIFYMSDGEPAGDIKSWVKEEYERHWRDKHE